MGFFWMIFYFWVSVICVFPTTISGTKPIAYRYVDTFTKIWDDGGSGAHHDVSYWQPTGLFYDYFPLGDVAVPSHSKPSAPALMVKDLGGASLAKPNRFEEIWNDRGSGVSTDVKIMKMIPPSGYTCLGNVVVTGYSTTPNKDFYRCVKSAYVEQGALTRVWKDSGSGASKDVSNWEVVKGSASIHSWEAKTFLSRASHSKPSDTPYLLKSSAAVGHLEIELEGDEVEIKLYKTENADNIWDDKSSGANSDFSCWRPKAPAGTWPLGDIPKNNYNKPSVSLTAKGVKDGALAPPLGYTLRWDDKGSGATKDGLFWEPNCPAGYVALGHVCQRGYGTPSKDAIRCVRHDLVSQGGWRLVWRDHGSGARKDGGAFVAETTRGDQQGLDTIGTIGNHGNMDRTAFVLKGSSTLVVDNKPVKSYVLTDVVYDLHNKNILSSDGINMASTTLTNKGTTVQQMTKVLTYTKSQTSSWSSTNGFEVSVSLLCKAGIPLVGGSETTITVTGSHSHTTGGSITESNSAQSRVTVSVLPRHTKMASVVARQFKADVPYTATIRIEYVDGSVDVRKNAKGVYRGVNVSEVNVVYEKDVPIDG